MVPGSPAERVLAVIEMAQDGRFEAIRDLFLEQARPLVSAEALRGAWDEEIGRLGAISSIGTPVTELGPHGVAVVKVPVACERGAMAVVGSLTASGQLTGLQFPPPSAAEPTAPWEPPVYADPERFEEEAVSVGSGPLAVPGTLSIPAAPRPCPAIVLLAGSGPNDRDGTIGRNKPLKDLTWGLASRGIGVLRFDKVTFAHPGEVEADQNFTVADEYVHHAVAAVGVLLAHPAVDSERIFLAGHSLGGTVAPRVAEAEPALAGLILLAGGTEPLQWAAVRQVRYLASLNPDTAAASQSMIETLSEQARRVDSPALSPSAPSSGLPFGVPAAYWLDLRTYQPADVAAALGKPMLILQGGRDYQATVEEDLVTWQWGLAGRPGVTTRIYPADNHFFISGSEPSTPAEYELVRHMDATVISDIAEWITGQAA
jgi:uncharacterized protein